MNEHKAHHLNDSLRLKLQWITHLSELPPKLYFATYNLLCSVLEMDFHPLIFEYQVFIKINTVMNYGL